jgi:hypothetical protein
MQTPYGLGRLPARDERDRRFLLMEHPRAQTITKVLDKTWAFFSRPLDQGNTGTCVGHGWKHCLMAAPIVRKKDDKPSPFDIYDAAIKVDEFPDNDNDTDRQMGTSVRAGAKVLQTLGLLDEYAWITTADEARPVRRDPELGAALGHQRERSLLPARGGSRTATQRRRRRLHSHGKPQEAGSLNDGHVR